MSSVFLIPLIALVVLRYVRDELDGRQLVVRLGPLLALQLLFATEIAFTVTLALACSIALGLVVAPDARHRLVTLLAPLGISYLVAAVLTAPFLYFLLAGFQRSAVHPQQTLRHRSSERRRPDDPCPVGSRLGGLDRAPLSRQRLGTGRVSGDTDAPDHRALRLATMADCGRPLPDRSVADRSARKLRRRTHRGRQDVALAAVGPPRDSASVGAPRLPTAFQQRSRREACTLRGAPRVCDRRAVDRRAPAGNAASAAARARDSRDRARPERGRLGVDVHGAAAVHGGGRPEVSSGSREHPALAREPERHLGSLAGGGRLPFHDGGRLRPRAPAGVGPRLACRCHRRARIKRAGEPGRHPALLHPRRSTSRASSSTRARRASGRARSTRSRRGKTSAACWCTTWPAPRRTAPSARRRASRPRRRDR